MTKGGLLYHGMNLFIYALVILDDFCKELNILLKDRIFSLFF